MLHFLRNENKNVDERKDPGFTTDPLLSFVESCIEMALALSGCIHRIGRWENFNRKPHQI